MSDEKTYYDKIIIRIKNNKFLAILLLVIVAYFGVSKLIKVTNDTIDAVKPNVSKTKDPAQKDTTVTGTSNKPPSTNALFVIKGKVHNEVNQAIENVKINVIEKAMVSDLTDSEGYFILELPELETGTSIELLLSKKGYKPWTKKISQTGSKNIKLNKIILEREIIRQPEIRPLEQKAKPKKQSTPEGVNTNINNAGTIGNVVTGKDITINLDKPQKDTSDEKNR